MRKDECKFCASRRCFVRIVTSDLKYDEVACGTHTRDLELHADKTIAGITRMHHSSSGALKRGEIYPASSERQL